MENINWTWLVSYGAHRRSVCVERDGAAAVRKFKRTHEKWEIVTRPAGRHWDGGKA